MNDKAIRAAKLTLGAVMDKRRAQTAKDRAGGQIAPSKYLPGVPRQVHAYGGRANEKSDIWWHGSPSGDLRGGTSGLHLGTKEAALDALRARIGVPADGSMWDGTKEYGKTLLAGKKTLNRMGKYLITGHNVGAPEEDYYPHQHPDGMPTVGNGVPVDPSWKPFLRPFKIVGPMTNTPFSPHGDSRANAMMKASLTKGNAKNGYYYKNDGEDSGSISAVVPNGSHVEPVDQDNKYADGGSVNDARATFLAGNHPMVPDVLYHGTARDVQSFDPQAKRSYDVDPSNPEETDTGWFGKGHYFTANPRVASHYAKEGAKRQGDQGANIIPAHVSMKNPFVVDMKAYDSGAKSLDSALSRAGVPMHPRGWRKPSEQTAALMAMGHDGVIATREGQPQEYVAFHPTQIKSAISARQFDTTDPDITKADGGSVTDNENFQNWFGNSVTHTNGEPHVFYTGTSKDKDFTSHNVGRHGAWFTRDPAEASSYAEQNDSQGYKRDGWNMVKTNTASRVIPAYVKAENPYTGELPEEYLRDNYKAAQSDWFDTLRAKGHDAWMPASQNGNLVVALKEPQQIKSIFNNGKFDPKQKHMNKADGGSVDDEDEGIDAYHGSPHDFDAFDISKLGTGEGAQSYGHGLYFAGNEGIAKHYRDALSDRNAPLGSFKKRDGSELDILHTPNGIYSLLGGDEPRNTDYDRLIAAANEKLQWAQSRKGPLREVHSKNAQEVLDFLKANEGLRFERNPARGHMYKVKLRVKPHELLDWDKPMSQQHPNVQAAINAIGVDTGAREWKTGANLGNGNRLIVTPHPDLPDDEQFAKYEMETPAGARIKLHRQDVERLLGKGDDLTGAQIHQRLVDMGNQQGAIGEHLRAGNPMKTGPKWAAEALMRHGIKGIRYRDAMSRNKEDGDATHNYVMFHHDPVKVVDKYEYGGRVDGEDEGIDAYHGSPHDFDEFDIAHLGTGEGAQAYGHGLYFAGNEGIAKYYRDSLRPELPLVHIDGKNTGKRIMDADQIVQNMLRNGMTPEQYHASLVNSPRYDGLQKAYQNASDVDEGLGVTDKDIAKWELDNFHKKLEEVKGYFGKKVSAFVPIGHMYKVKLNVKPHELLDWDKPLSEQPEVARRLGYADPEEIKRQKDLHYSKFKPRGGNSYEDLFGPLDPEESAAAEALSKMPEGWGNMTGKALHDRLVARTGSKKGAADAMLAAGLKGIRYLDAGSRDISDGDPTHNYVMFHHDPVKVVDKYEYGGAVGKSEGGSMGDDENRPVDLGVTRALRRFNQNGDGPTPEAEGVFNRLAAAQNAADEAHDAARKAGAFDSAQIGDVFKYKPLDTYAPMKVVGHGMVHVSRWGGINPPKYVFNDHFPVAHVEYQDASKERQRFPVELLEDRSRYDLISGKPRIARADGGRLDLYSKAARIIRGMKDQKMDVADILKYATGKGAKKTEIAHVDVPPGKATPSQVAEHIEFMQPQIGVHKREMFYRYRDPEQYERQINYLERQGRHDEAEELTREFEAFEGYGGKDAPLYAKYQLPGGENYREHVLTLDNHPDDQTYMAKMHWGRLANPLAHIRMSDRIIGNKKILHIEEMQSDWNNDARKSGFRTGREKQDYDDYVAKMREDAINGIDQNASPMIRDALRQKYSAMDPYMLALKMGRQPEHASLANSAFMGSKLPPRAPYINPEKDDVYEMAMKHVLMEAAKGGYDGIAFTPDEEQELRWPGHTFKGIYNKRLPGIAQRLVQPHDLDTDTDDMTRLNGWAVPMIPLSDKARDSITQNSFPSFRRGGYVTHVRRAR